MREKMRTKTKRRGLGERQRRQRRNQQISRERKSMTRHVKIRGKSLSA